ATVAARQSAENEMRARASALDATQKFISRLTGFLDDGTVRATGAQKFLDDAQVALQEAAANTSKHPPEVARIEISLLLAVSDVKDALGDSDGASKLAETAELISNSFVKNNPDDPKFKHLLYASKFRVGDQFGKTLNNKVSKERAFNAYRGALDVARKLAASEPGNKDYQHEVAVALDKVGDIYQYRQDWKVALDHYNEGLEIARAIGDVYPVDEATQLGRI